MVNKDEYKTFSCKEFYREPVNDNWQNI